MENSRNIKVQTDDMEAGCSALAWETEDGKHLWGRNFDHSRIAEGSRVTYFPRKTEYTTWCRKPGNGERAQSRYACVGTGFTEISSAPVLYEGINEKGLMGGQLYYRGFARYSSETEAGEEMLQPPFAVLHLLAQCRTVNEAVRIIEKETTLVNTEFLGTVPPLHWAFCDKTGEMAVIEPDEEGLRIYRDTIGVMTNSPGYSWHRLNLLNYAGLRDEDNPEADVGKEKLEQCFSGSGAQGIPGDCTSPSRFVRLVFLKKYAVKGRNETDGAAYMFRLLQNAAFPLGAVRVTDQGHITEYDKEVKPYDYTVYTSVMCPESLRFYWNTYEKPGIRYVDLNRMMKKKEIISISLDDGGEFISLS